MNIVIDNAECSSTSLSPTSPCRRTLKKPLKGCLKAPSPLPSPSLGSPGSSRGDTFASFAQACADLQASSSNSRFSLPSNLNLSIPGSTSSSSSSGTSTPTSDGMSSCNNSGIATPATDGSLTPTTRARKNVSFCSEDDGLEEVFIADVWDRTPTEPAGHLSYQDILELKAIQRTLPRAQQLPDLYTGKPAHHYLKHVPVGLLPLTDQSSPSVSPLATPHPTPVSTPGGSPNDGHGSPTSSSVDNSPPRSPVSGVSGSPKSPHFPSSHAPGAWHSYTPSTSSPLAAAALAAAFASKNVEKRVFPNNPIPSNLGPKFVPPVTPPVSASNSHENDSSTNSHSTESTEPSTSRSFVHSSSSPTCTSPTTESPPTPKSSATANARDTSTNSTPAPTSYTPSSPNPIPNPFAMAHLLPSRSNTPMRRKPNFAFLPLLDTPPTSEGNTPTTATPVLAPVDHVSASSEASEANEEHKPVESAAAETTSLLGSPIALNDTNPSVDISKEDDLDPPLPSEASSSSSSSYASDSERESGSGSGSSWYTGGSPLSRTTSVTSVSTAASASLNIDVDMDMKECNGSAYTDETDSGDPGFFLIPPSKRANAPPKTNLNGYFNHGSGTGGVGGGGDMPQKIRDPRLRAVASPPLAPPSPLSLDAGPGALGARSETEPRVEADLAMAMRDRLERVQQQQEQEQYDNEYTEEDELLSGAEPFTRTRTCSSASSSKSSSTPVSRGVSRESSRERGEKEDLERRRRAMLGCKWTPPSSRGPSRANSRPGSRAPSRERNVVEINGVEIDLDGDD